VVINQCHDRISNRSRLDELRLSRYRWMMSEGQQALAGNRRLQPFSGHISTPSSYRARCDDALRKRNWRKGPAPLLCQKNQIDPTGTVTTLSGRHCHGNNSKIAQLCPETGVETGRLAFSNQADGRFT
jgi:hypothetical protein